MKPKRKYTKRKFSAAANEARLSDNKSSKSPQVKSGFDAKLVTSDLTRFSRVFQNDMLTQLCAMQIKASEIENSDLIKDLSEIIETAFLDLARAELSQNRLLDGFEVLNLKTNNKLWVYKPIWERFVAEAKP